MSNTAPSVDVGILTIRDDEFRALLAVFAEDVGVHRGRREYALRSADAGAGHRYSIALLRQIEQGNGEAQDAARDLLEDLEPSLLLVVGIAAGLPSDDVTLGDVILSTRVNDYSVEARKSRSRPTYSLSGGPIEKRLAATVANLPARERDLGAWTDELPARPQVNWGRAGQLYGPKRWQRELREKLESHFGRGATPRAPTFLSGHIASSDRLVKDPTLLFPWIQTARHLLAVEMESGGVYRAARDRCPMLAVRGISDLVGLKRSDAWTKFACASAAAFTRAFLRTRPVRLRNSPPTVGSAREKAAAGAATAQSRVDTLVANVAPLVDFPKTLYISPATCASYKQAWARLLTGEKGHIAHSWVLHEDNLYSFLDPSTSRLSRIADAGATEEHATSEWAESPDPDKRRLFVHLLNGVLQDDLGTVGVWFISSDELYAFAGHPGEPPRRYQYKNVRMQSTMTVVSHYTSHAKDGREFTYLRHLAFAPRFRLLGGRWHLEINPTYRFTSNGKAKYRFHEQKLSGIKRLEGNRAVLSQVLLWGHVLTAPGSTNTRRLLTFGPLPTFTVERAVADEDLTPIEAMPGAGPDVDPPTVTNEDGAE